MGSIGRLLTNWEHVRVFPPEDVVSVDVDGETLPEAVGLSRRSVERIWQSVLDLYRTGLHPAIALCVRRHGRVVMNRAIGHALGNAPGAASGTPLVRATPGTLFPLYSASKAILAMLIHKLDERGLLRVDDRVCDHLPEFGCNGKSRITLRQVLSHQAGIAHAPRLGDSVEDVLDESRVLERLCESRPVHLPGGRPGYHAITGGFILAAVATRVTGQPIRELLRENIVAPLGLEGLDYGVTSEQLPNVARSVFTGAPPAPPATWVFDRALGVPVRDAIRISNDPRFLQSPLPSIGIIATAEATSRFFQLLLDEGESDGVRIFDRSTVRRAVAAQGPATFDGMIGLPMRYGLGFMLGGRWPGLYGAGTSNAFGHIGFTTITAWADPDRAISVALLMSGKPLLTPGQLWWLRVVRTVTRECPRVR